MFGVVCCLDSKSTQFIFYAHFDNEEWKTFSLYSGPHWSQNVEHILSFVFIY